MIFFSPPQLTSRTKAKEQALPPNTPYNIPKRGRTSLRDSPPGQEIPRDKKFPGTRNLPGQEIPRDKKSPGTRNPPGQEIPQDKQSLGTTNPPGQAIPWDNKSFDCKVIFELQGYLKTNIKALKSTVEDLVVAQKT